jgi:hypothetical protein
MRTILKWKLILVKHLAWRQRSAWCRDWFQLSFNCAVPVEFFYLQHFMPQRERFVDGTLLGTVRLPNVASGIFDDFQYAQESRCQYRARFQSLCNHLAVKLRFCVYRYFLGWGGSQTQRVFALFEYSQRFPHFFSGHTPAASTISSCTPIKPLYGKQEGDAYPTNAYPTNPKRPVWPSQSYHTHLMAGLRLTVGAEVNAGNEYAGRQTLPGLMKTLDIGRVNRSVLAPSRDAWRQRIRRCFWWL